MAEKLKDTLKMLKEVMEESKKTGLQINIWKKNPYKRKIGTNKSWRGTIDIVGNVI